MVNTLKFSEFATADPENPTNTMAGISAPTGGINVKSPFVLKWTTAGRPASPFDGLMGFNSTIDEWEFFQASTGEWKQFATTSSGINWTVVTDAAVNAVVNEGYVTNRAATPVQLLLPATFNIGDRILVMGFGAGGWSIVANTGQTIVFGSVSSSVEGSISSDIQYSNIELKGLATDTTWSVWSINSNPTII